jgi:hypothetical protein
VFTLAYRPGEEKLQADLDKAGRLWYNAARWIIRVWEKLEISVG